jgi:TPR repeat protein
MTNASELFESGDAAEDAGEFGRALLCFEQGAALGCNDCLERLALMYDVGKGVQISKTFAMRCYQKSWRRGGNPANNIAILYREQGDLKAMVRWYKRAIERGHEDARVELAKCYSNGDGVRRSAGLAKLHLRVAIKAYYITEAGREEAASLLRALEVGSSPTDPLQIRG